MFLIKSDGFDGQSFRNACWQIGNAFDALGSVAVLAAGIDFEVRSNCRNETDRIQPDLYFTLNRMEWRCQIQL